MRALVEVRGLEKRFALPSHFLAREKPVLHALNGVDAVVRQGEAFCVVGESGCGKTTLGRIVMGLTEPSNGEVHFDGTRIDNLGETHRRPFRARMQMVFQNPYASLNPRRTVFDTLAEPLRHLSPQMRRAEVREAVEAVMLAVGADPKWGRRMPHEFSGGQRQRIAIARALVTDPEFIVADEPISALDVSIQAQILNLMTKAREERGLTYLFITHDLSVVQHFGDRVAVMYLGRIVEQTATASLFDTPRHPYSEALLGSVLTPDPTQGVPDTHLGASYPNPLEMPSGCTFHPRCPKAMAHCSQVAPRPVPAPGGHVECHLYDEGSTTHAQP
jgi:peptide/nickel transport system ATP-binding protein